MKKSLLFVCLILFTGMVLPAQDMAVATVRLEKTEPISGKQLQQTVAALEKQQGRTLTTAQKKEVLDQLIDQLLVIQAATVDKTVVVTLDEVQQASMRLVSQQLQSVGAIPPGAVLTDKMQYKQVMEQQGLNVEEFEKTVRNQILAEKYITSRDQQAFQAIGKATAAELNAEYQRRVSEFVVSDSVFFNHIFFETQGLSPADAKAKQTKAAEVYRRLMNSGETFADLVAKESEDKVSKTRGGLIGPVMEGDQVALQLYGADFMAKAFALNVGDVSQVLKSNVGYHIIRITEKKSAQLLPKDDPEVKSYLEQIIFAGKYQKKFEEVTQKVIKDLRGRATINYFGEYR